jgi:hypothetical protein
VKRNIFQSRRNLYQSLIERVRNEDNMTNKGMNVWEYTDWLYGSGRLTAEEHSELKRLLLKLEEESLFVGEQGC